MAKHYLQEKLAGAPGQLVGFDTAGNAAAVKNPASVDPETAARFGLPDTAGLTDVINAFRDMGTFRTYRYVEFRTSADWVVPEGILNNKVMIFCVGGGGGGGCSNPDFQQTGGGGGGGGRLETGILDVVPGETLRVEVGAGGPGGKVPAKSGESGGNTVIWRGGRYLLCGYGANGGEHHDGAAYWGAGGAGGSGGGGAGTMDKSCNPGSGGQAENFGGGGPGRGVKFALGIGDGTVRGWGQPGNCGEFGGVGYAGPQTYSSEREGKKGTLGTGLYAVPFLGHFYTAFDARGGVHCGSGGYGGNGGLYGGGGGFGANGGKGCPDTGGGGGGGGGFGGEGGDAHHEGGGGGGGFFCKGGSGGPGSGGDGGYAGHENGGPGGPGICVMVYYTEKEENVPWKEKE